MADDFRAVACSWGESICYYVTPHTADGRFIHDAILISAHWVRDYGGAIGALGGVAFGILQVYWSWEHKMYDHLSSILDKDNTSLAQIRSVLGRYLLNPGPAVALVATTLSERSLESVFSVRNWRSTLESREPVTIADERIERAINDIRRQKILLKKRSDNFDNQLADALMVKGAVAAARAQSSRSIDEVATNSARAIAAFESILQLDDHKRDLLATEALGLEYFRLERFDGAASIFAKMEQWAIEGHRLYGSNSVAIAKWRQAQASFGSGQNAAANVQMINADAALLPQLSDVSTDLYLARLHKFHFDIRFEMGLGGNGVLNESYLRAKLRYDLVISRLKAKRDTLWKRFKSQWNNYWNQDRYAEMLEQAEEERSDLEAKSTERGIGVPAAPPNPTSSTG